MNLESSVTSAVNCSNFQTKQTKKKKGHIQSELPSIDQTI